MIRLDRLDHIVLTVSSIEHSCAFYRDTLGMTVEVFGDGRKALRFGNQKINLHETGSAIAPKARYPTMGSADLCFIAANPLSEVITQLEALNVQIRLGPVSRTGAVGPIQSIYIRDPDENLIEISNYR
jgi:catechol 2,3-dioxygenase-like lactoylglutathione lyase family enzyme